MQKENTKKERPPVVVVLGHVDHGKTTLLDYIRSSKVADKEAGGITQHIGAYEVVAKDEEGVDKRITFIDTPGHAAFGKMRERGAAVADIAILVVAADDGVKPQTLEAIDAIKKSDVPFIVAVTKIDKADASLDRAKQTLAEAEVYVEGYGGSISITGVSGKTGEGVDNLLSLVLLQASLLELTTDTEIAGRGIVVESNRDLKKGSLATLIIKDGKVKQGDAIVVGSNASVVRTLHNFLGKVIDEAVASAPVLVSGFSELPEVGEEFQVCASKKEADALALSRKTGAKAKEKTASETEVVLPLVLKADTLGTLEAIEAELAKRQNEKVSIKIVNKGAGIITESDIKLLLGTQLPLVVGFNVTLDKHAKDLAEKNDIPVQLFDIIYKLTEWFDEYIQGKTPKEVTESVTGEAKILKTFSRTKDRIVLGGHVRSGSLERGKKVRIKRRDEVLGEGKIVNLQAQRNDVDSVPEGEQFGAVIESKLNIVEGDSIEIVTTN